MTGVMLFLFLFAGSDLEENRFVDCMYGPDQALLYVPTWIDCDACWVCDPWCVVGPSGVVCDGGGVGQPYCWSAGRDECLAVGQCQAYDFDRDGDVDLTDWAVLQRGGGG